MTDHTPPRRSLPGDSPGCTPGHRHHPNTRKRHPVNRPPATPGHRVAALPDVALQPGEPPATDWWATDQDTLVRYLLSLREVPPGRPRIIAIDGRGGSGKTTLAALLQRVIPKTGVLHTDDLAWNEPLFQWDHVLIDALEQLHATGALTLTPPAWRAHGREGHIVIPPGTTTVLVEGTGAGMRAATPLLDAHLWVQTADDVAQERGLRRDIAEGVNGDAVESVRFWHHWMAAERAFFADDRPWERADVILCGVTLPGLGAGEVAWNGPSTP